MWLHALSVFLSAFLLFQVQPLIGRIIVPWFGGSAAVWAACLLFFQGMLLLGYLYTHRLQQRLPGAAQSWAHVALLAASLAALPVFPNPAWKPAGAEDPTLRILGLLATSIGLPYFLLSATTPLVQAWYARSGRGGSPYRLFALSNAGSLVGLVSYPVLVEPLFSARQQTVGWSATYAVVCVLLAALALLSRRQIPAHQSADPAPITPAPHPRARLLWVALAACGAALLFAVTNHLTQNIAPVPFLWVLPLSLYLLSFVLCFGPADGGWYRRGVLLKLLAVALGGMAFALDPDFANVGLWLLVPLFSAGLFVCCMVCHGELARLKPVPVHLTSFYLMVALGGCLGGAFVSLVAPRAYRGYYELPISLVACAALVLIVLHRDPGSTFYRARLRPAWLLLNALVLLLAAQLGWNAWKEAGPARVMARNFYGRLRVVDQGAPRVVVLRDGAPQSLENERATRKLLHGTVDHGIQFLAASRRREPVGYYGRESGVGLALAELQQRGALRVGVIGLGTGTLAAYGRLGDLYTFYEINPLVTGLAYAEFRYLRDTQAHVSIVPGDARLSLERQPRQGFDLLAVDAFSGDAIPVHLLTREAFELYFRHLRPGGVLAVHISNNYLDLEPVVARAAESLGKRRVAVRTTGDDQQALFNTTWVLLSDSSELFDSRSLRRAARALRTQEGLRLWTDDYSNLLQVLK
jgi:spermidine synthase